MDFLLDGRECPALPLDGLAPDGTPDRAVYFYKSTEGSGPVEVRLAKGLVWIPDDDGASWTASNHPTGAFLAVRVPDGTNEGVVLNRLIAAYNNKKRAEKALQDANAGANDPNATAPDSSSGEQAGSNVTAPLSAHDQHKKDKHKG